LSELEIKLLNKILALLDERDAGITAYLEVYGKRKRKK